MQPDNGGRRIFYDGYGTCCYGGSHDTSGTRLLRQVPAPPGLPYNSPGYYLRHCNYELRVERAGGRDLFRQDSSFTPVAVWA
ncbi:AbfB domain-containing protein [Streptomyces sp. AC550_RSS872]|uniref:AbfB domain-containing protein n=1 Tax=Streptomyces sp. AC550_RSS872 TaxID=2823689 RepID=UPI0027E5A6DD|nr:AbfB domain-containing protein [Streptomyces sp. AC550_RSS872]